MNFIGNQFSWQQELYLVSKICLAFILGGIIGWEREIAGKDAGIRTFGYISMGSAAFSMFSLSIQFGDASRIAAQIVLGIGFLGSGLFVRNEERLTGLTTAASLWVSAAVGMGIGFSYYIIAVCLTMITAVSLHMPATGVWAKLSKKKKRRIKRSKTLKSIVSTIKTEIGKEDVSMAKKDKINHQGKLK